MQRFTLVPMILWCVFGTTHGTNAQSPELIGVGEFPATRPDRSGLTGHLENGEPHNRMGGISAIEYLGHDDQYLAMADRGPDDGATAYQCRVHRISIHIDPLSKEPVRLQLLGSDRLVDCRGCCFVGDATAITESTEFGHRLDPEGLRMVGTDQFLVCEEYGPKILRFNHEGKSIDSIPVPSAFCIAKPAGTKNEENLNNESGRASNKGLEGLAISPDGSTITCVMQNVMLQDGQRDETGAPHGQYCRMLQIDLESGQTSQFVYRLDHPDNVLSEILAISATEFLVIERDYKAGEEAVCKHIKRIDLAGATDISGLDRLPPSDMPEDIHPVRKTTYLDMLDPRYGIGGVRMPEKLEGLTFGPDLSDGRKTLLIASDNDFNLENASFIYAFACTFQ
tara:strand:- start:331 stop:1515 length:1185 start_codon:yes stop_codon:yes gene_type:complete